MKIELAEKEIWFKLSDIPEANYISLFAYNLVNLIIDYPVVGAGNYITEGFVDWDNGIASYHLKRNQFNRCADALASDIIHMTKTHKQRVKKYYILAKKLMVESETFRQLHFSEMSDHELLDEFKEIAALHRQNHLYGGILTFLPDEEQQRVSNAIFHKIKELIKESKSDLSVVETWNILTTPNKKSFREKEEIDILKICIEILQNKDLHKNIMQNENFFGLMKEDEKISNLLMDHHQKYCWIPYMYTGPIYDREHYYSKIKKNLTQGSNWIERSLKNANEKHKKIVKQQQKVLSLLKPCSKDKQLLKFAKEIVFLKGYRKDTFYHLFYCYEPFLKEIAKRINVDVRDVGFLFPWEFENALINKKYSKRDLENRRLSSLYYMKGNKIKFYFNENREKFKEKIKIEKITKVGDSVKGMVAHPGYAKGFVKIIQNPGDMEKMKEGDILISQMTNPNLVLAMQKAAAIVTDTGGLTCHASILSRELKIPCIVGTNIATKVLKDGDLVEVDADKGIVKRIKL